MRSTRKFLAWAATIALASTALLATQAPALAAAAPAAASLKGSDFDPGLIASDEVFFNGGAMSKDKIQSFLESKETGCVSGATCLKNYKGKSTSRAADPMCKAVTGVASESAASMLYKVAKACNVNPQVLLVTLEKEQSLVTSTNPSSGRYRIAMGYACPDTAACDSKYYGFFNQIYSAARQFVRYGMPPGTGPGTAYTTNYNWFPVGTATQVRYNPKASCGAKTVTIKSKATAALYYYTPYTPNKAALNNLYGTGDSCSSYGNRNFWRLFNDWFGSPIIPEDLRLFVSQVYVDVLGRTPSTKEPISWVRAIMKGMPRQQVAGGFVNSTEYRLLKIDEAYREVLGREPDAGGRASWLTGIKQGVISPDGVYRTFLSTKEFYLNSGGTNETFVNSLFQLIVGREATVSEQTSWAKTVASKGRKSVIASVYASTESLRFRANESFLTYLRRPMTDAEASTWVAYLRANGAIKLRAKLLATTEYWTLAQGGPLDPYTPEPEEPEGTDEPETPPDEAPPTGDGLIDPASPSPTPSPSTTP